MLSRRAGRTFSHLVYGTGIHAHFRGHLVALAYISRTSNWEAARSRVIRVPGGSAGCCAPWSEGARWNIGPVACGPMFPRAGGGTGRGGAGRESEGGGGGVGVIGAGPGRTRRPRVHRRDHCQREPPRLVVASMVSRRTGRTRSHLASGTGIPLIHHGARIHRNLS